MKFEMPKMNVAIFSCENIVTTSGGVNPPAVKSNTDLATEALGLNENSVTTATSASNWMNA